MASNYFQCHKSKVFFFIFPHRILYCPFNLAPSPPFNQGPPPPLYKRMRQAKKNKEAGMAATTRPKQYLRSTCKNETFWSKVGPAKSFHFFGTFLYIKTQPGIFSMFLMFHYKVLCRVVLTDLGSFLNCGRSEGTNPKIGLCLLFFWSLTLFTN